MSESTFEGILNSVLENVSDNSYLDIDEVNKILKRTAKEGEIVYSDIKVDERLKQDIILFLVKNNFINPLKTSKSLAWEDRIIKFNPDERYKMPQVIRFLIINAYQMEEWNPRKAVKLYLDEIGEKHSIKFVEFFEIIMNRSVSGKISAEKLKKIAQEEDLIEHINKIIAEFKGGGILSPYLRNPKRLRYEINSALYL